MNNAENVFINLEKSIDEQLFQVEVLNYFLNHSIKYFKNSSKFYINFKTNTFTDYQGKENNIGPYSLTALSTYLKKLQYSSLTVYMSDFPSNYDLLKGRVYFLLISPEYS